jgi:hypothetical protein
MGSGQVTAITPTLFKFLPSNFVTSLLDGTILFRNLVYFKKLEGDARSDIFEGRHVDAPDHDVQIDNLTTGKKLRGPFTFHNAIEHPERIFCFCTSLHVTDEMTRLLNSAIASEMAGAVGF